ncbi:MAG: response regulator [Steroidobacteraceae bacterium]|jgi:CheY-like chemotaxis protein
MARKCALVVDDSKSARVILSRMLEKYDIEVDMAESAEQAIEYLNNNRPDAIFMDQLMPGMDGLQAVHAIKSNPQTATIPIMMYTSQEGELYVGQARALGAMGVLPKQVRPVDVSKVLYELHMLPDRRDMAEPALLPVELDDSGSVAPAGATAGNAMATPAGPDWGRRVEAAVKEQAADVRRFITASLDGFAARIVNEVRAAAPLVAPERPPIVVPRQPVWPWAALLLATLSIAAVCAVLLASTREQLTQARAELAALTSSNADLRRSSQELGSMVKDLTAALASSTASLSAEAPANGAATSRVEPVPYGEIPFDRSRLEVLREFLSKLEAQGFRGAVRITSAAGLFCLSGNATDGYAPAAAALPVGKCDLLGNPFDESLTGQQRQSVDFANLIASLRQRTSGAISVVIDNAGTSRPAAPYPQRSESLTAGEWNRAAAFNNRVEFATDPTAGP